MILKSLFAQEKNLKGTQIPASVINFSFVDYEQLEDTIRNMDLPIVWTNNDGFIESQSYRKEGYYKFYVTLFSFSFFPYNYFTYFNTFFFHSKNLQLDRHHLAKVGFGFYVYHNCGFTTYDLSGPKHVVLDNKIRWVQYWVLSTRANQSKQNHTLFLNITMDQI